MTASGASGRSHQTSYKPPFQTSRRQRDGVRSDPFTLICGGIAAGELGVANSLFRTQRPWRAIYWKLLPIAGQKPQNTQVLSKPSPIPSGGAVLRIRGTNKPSYSCIWTGPPKPIRVGGCGFERPLLAQSGHSLGLRRQLSGRTADVGKL
jgi:hypothetical protein